MGEREWKPGDVAMVNGRVCVRLYDGWEHGDERAFPFNDGERLDLRPLVVIDPEDREQVERLWDAVMGVAGIGEMQAALREFANPTPPRPEEPTGLGAVVEDRNERRWTRAGSSSMHGNWLSLGSTEYVGWDEIAAVRVLSEGVTS